MPIFLIGRNEKETMLNIYTIEQAQQTILRRENWLEREVPAGIQSSLNDLFDRLLTPAEAVQEILADVRVRGDNALREWTGRIDGVELDAITVPAAELAAARRELPAGLHAALDQAAERIRAFHAAQPLPN